MLSWCRKACRGTKKKLKAVKRTVVSRFRGSKQKDENLGTPPSIYKTSPEKNSTYNDSFILSYLENGTGRAEDVCCSLPNSDGLQEPQRSQDDKELSQAFPVETFPPDSTSLKVQEIEPEAQGSYVPKQNVEIQQPPVSSAPYIIGPGEEFMVTQWSPDVSYLLSSSTSSLDEGTDVPILYEQSQFSPEEKNVWLHNMCQQFSSLPLERGRIMVANIAQRHLTSILEHCLESDQKECEDIFYYVIASPKCNLDVVLRFLLDKANKGSWLPQEGEEKLRVKVLAARTIVAIIEQLCDFKRLQFWSNFLFSTYLDILSNQPRRTEEETKNKESYLVPEEIACFLSTLVKRLASENQMLPDVTR
ncbi:uncharacterized protein LOC121915911 isoform X2 [Sceloporus undulatus]|uniref:uncharacterized protein LOC121915911 isoform X2 n=1 Tax=Sceloporus undulatus TaxID=8520 RepID=UPI001C4B55F8|nr:uncharacterized protein LOC121915911 isoform X2 [Sceloporus undulatus]